MYINTKTVGNKDEILHEHQIDLTEIESLSIKIVNNVFNKITDALMHDDDFVNFKNGTMIADDVMFMSSMLNSIVDYIKEE
jgi:hypothetical protein